MCVCVLPRGAWRPWITLGRRAALVWAGLPAARAATRKKPKDETHPAIVTSSPFLAFVSQLRVVRLPLG